MALDYGRVAISSYGYSEPHIAACKQLPYFIDWSCHPPAPA
jgi:hypothetical protein